MSNNYIDIPMDFTTLAAGAIASPLIALDTPLTLREVVVRTTAVAGSPSAATVAITLTDGTTTKTPIAATSIGVTAAQTHIRPTAAIQGAGTNTAPMANGWRVAMTVAYTGGSGPTITGRVVFRFTH